MQTVPIKTRYAQYTHKVSYLHILSNIVPGIMHVSNLHISCLTMYIYYLSTILYIHVYPLFLLAPPIIINHHLLSNQKVIHPTCFVTAPAVGGTPWRSLPWDAACGRWAWPPSGGAEGSRCRPQCWWTQWRIMMPLVINNGSLMNGSLVVKIMVHNGS